MFHISRFQKFPNSKAKRTKCCQFFLEILQVSYAFQFYVDNRNSKAHNHGSQDHISTKNEQSKSHKNSKAERITCGIFVGFGICGTFGKWSCEMLPCALEFVVFAESRSA